MDYGSALKVVEKFTLAVSMLNRVIISLKWIKQCLALI